MNTRELIYGAEYARQYPMMRDKWAARSGAECWYAKRDIFDTLTLHDLSSAPAYVAKLYQAWREASRFSLERGSVAVWLTMMARSRALDLVRSHSRRQRITETAARESPTEGPAMSSGTPPPGAAVLDDERRSAVTAGLAALSPPQRDAIELAYYQGLSQTEIAERLKEPLGTIKTRMRLGMQQLRESLRPYYFEGAL